MRSLAKLHLLRFRMISITGTSITKLIASYVVVGPIAAAAFFGLVFSTLSVAVMVARLNDFSEIWKVPFVYISMLISQPLFFVFFAHSLSITLFLVSAIVTITASIKMRERVTVLVLVIPPITVLLFYFWQRRFEINIPGAKGALALDHEIFILPTLVAVVGGAGVAWRFATGPMYESTS